MHRIKGFAGVLALALAALFTLGGVTAPTASATSASPSSTQIVWVSGSYTYDQGEDIYGPVNGYYSDWSSPCWTSFSPSNPGGASMNHYYENCASYNGGYCPAVRINNTGPLYVFGDFRAWLAPKPTQHWGIDWYYPTTTPNGWYTTITC